MTTTPLSLTKFSLRTTVWVILSVLIVVGVAFFVFSHAESFLGAVTQGTIQVKNDTYTFTVADCNPSCTGTSVLANDVDTKGGTLTATLIYQGGFWGTMQMQPNGEFTYTPNKTFIATVLSKDPKREKTSELVIYRVDSSKGGQGNASIMVQLLFTGSGSSSSSQGPSIPASWVNVRTFGAKGDGITDDTLAIRKAIDATQTINTGAVVYFPAGTYMVSPQPTDPDWPNLSDPNWLSKSVGEGIFFVTRSNIQFRGEGADRSTISVKTIDPKTGKTGADPNTTWTVVSIGKQQLVFRGAAFRIARGNQQLDNISFIGLRITGNTLATNDHTVGGNPVTGVGWDMSHKAIAVNSGLPVSILIEDCRIDGWRGESVYSGGMAASKITIRRSTIEECNASAVATSAFTTIEDSTLRNVYNGTENYCLGKEQGLVVRNTTFETTRPGNWVHGIVYEGGKGIGATMDVTNSTFKGMHRGIYIAGGAEDVTVNNSKFQDTVNGILIGSAGNDKIFSNLSFTNNTFSVPTGAAVVLSSYRIPMTNVLIQGNTATGKMFLNDSSITRTGLVIRDNKISSDTIYTIEAGGVPPSLWINNQYLYSDALWKHFKPITDRSDVKAGQVTIAPSREAYAVQLLGGGDVVVNLLTTATYPSGYAVNVMRYGDMRGTMRIVPASWNTLSQPVTVTAQGVTLRHRDDGKWELVM